MNYFKDPDSELDYGVDWSPWLGTDTIASAVWTLPAVLTHPRASSVAGAVTTVWLAGGDAGTRYLVSCRVTTAAGRIDDRSLRIICTPR